MNTLTDVIRELSDHEGIIKTLSKKKAVSLSGCSDSQKIHIAEGLSDGFKYKIIATYSDIRVKEIAEDLKLYGDNVLFYPAKDLIFYQADIHGNRLVSERLKVLRSIVEDTPFTVVTTFDALMSPVLPIEHVAAGSISISKNDLIDTKSLASDLVDIGYIRNYQVEEPGQFSIRGDIIDIFDTTETNPFRIELWGDEVESLRSFDIDTQRSIEELSKVSIFPASEMILSKDMLEEGLRKIEKDKEKVYKSFRDDFKTEEAHRIDTQVKTLKEDLLELGRVVNLDSYASYFYDDLYQFIQMFDVNDTVLIFDEPVQIAEHAKAVELEFDESMKNRALKGYILPGQMNLLYSSDQVRRGFEKYPVIQLSSLESRNLIGDAAYRCNITAKSIAPYKNQFEYLIKDLELYRKRGYRIILLCPSSIS